MQAIIPYAQTKLTREEHNWAIILIIAIALVAVSAFAIYACAKWGARVEAKGSFGFFSSWVKCSK